MTTYEEDLEALRVAATGITFVQAEAWLRSHNYTRVDDHDDTPMYAWTSWLNKRDDIVYSVETHELAAVPATPLVVSLARSIAQHETGGGPSFTYQARTLKILNEMATMRVGPAPASARLNDDQLDNLIANVLASLDYDLWREFFAYPDCAYAEEPEKTRKHLEELRSVVRRSIEEPEAIVYGDPLERLMLAQVVEADAEVMASLYAEDDPPETI